MANLYRPDLDANPDDQKRVPLRDVGREHIIDEVCVQELRPPKER